MALAPEPRPDVAAIRPCSHGSIAAAEIAALGLDAAGVLDFSVNTNPLGPAPGVQAALAELDLSRYPDCAAGQLRLALAQRLRVDAEEIIVGNGSAELLWLLAIGYLRPGDGVIVFRPTFGEYERAARMMGARVITVTGFAEGGFAPRLDVGAEAIRRERPRLVFLCNPNNPTGAYIQREAVEGLLAESVGALLVLDEAYLAFVEDPWQSTDLISRGDVVLLRSLTKDCALAGLRLGYAVAKGSIIGVLRAVQPPWSVNAAAQAAGLAALADDEHLQRSRGEVRASKAYLVSALAGFGLRVTAGAANFILVDVGDARVCRSALLRLGCCVRDCSSFGLPQFIRIGVRTMPECRRLVGAMAEVLRRGEI